MSLLIDCDQVTTADLLALDPEVAAVATAEGITVEGAGSIIRQSWDESKDELLGALQSIGGNIFVLPGTITQSGAFGANRPRLQAGQIVVTSNTYDATVSPLKRWMIYRSLVLFFRAASNRREKDRYERKYQQYKSDLADRWRRVWENGIPWVASPLAAPGAVHDHQAGTFGSSNVGSVSSGSAASATYQVAITWTDGTYVSPSLTNNGESGPSAIVSFTVPASNVLQVNTLGLTAPGTVPFNVGIADGLRLTRTAAGWNVYVGSAAGPLYLQNSTPIALATTSLTLAGVPTLSGNQLQTGQSADQAMTMQRTLSLG